MGFEAMRGAQRREKEDMGQGQATEGSGEEDRGRSGGGRKEGGR